METKLKITDARYKDGHLVAQPTVEDSGASPVHFVVWVGNDEDGWVALPRVTNVDITLKGGELKKAIITVQLPEVELEGKGQEFR